MRLGPYEVLGELARGGMGAVFRGRAPDGKLVAIKLVLKATRETLDRFDRERRLLNELGEAAGFVPILDAGSSQQGPYLVMPLITGGTLRAKLERGRLPVAETIALGKKLATAIGKAHDRGIVHRDLKPENILFTEAGEPLIADLGLAKHFRSSSSGAESVALTTAGEFKGTVGYMAPEQTGRAKDAGPEADVFALGCVLYECLAGEPAFGGDSLQAVLGRVASGTVTPLRSARPDAPRWLARVIGQSLRTDPRSRWKNGAALARGLEDGPRVERLRRLTAFLFAVAAAGSIAAAVVFSKPQERHEGAPAQGAAATTSAVSTPQRKHTPLDDTPAWFRQIPASDRPAFPLPKGLSFGPAEGTYRNDADGSQLVFVPAGDFVMGDDFDDSQKRHRVTLSAYFIGRYEVTIEQYAAFAKATKYTTVAEDPNQDPRGGRLFIAYQSEQDSQYALPTASYTRPDGQELAPPNAPASQLAWEDAKAYVTWAHLTLPTEAQWERAAAWDPAAKKARKYPWGDQEPAAGLLLGNLLDETFFKLHPDRYARWVGYDDGFPAHAPVGSFPNDLSPVGCYDMGGNVREWCEDFYGGDFYSKGTAADPVNETSDYAGRIARGGSFAAAITAMKQPQFTCANRWRTMPSYRSWDMGFRVARSAR
jgi:formylglycine-generating enzyme required for sulfatase activity